MQRDDNDSTHQVFNKPVPEVFRSSQYYTLGDIAQHFYLKDLHDGLENELDPRGFDEATWQHVVTYGVAFGVFGNYNPDDFPDCLPTCDTPGALGCPDINQIHQIQCRNTVIAGQTVEECTSGVMALDGTITFDNWVTEGPYRYVCPDWPEQGAQGSRLTGRNTIDDLYHASINGRGAFLNAANPAELVAAMKKIKSLIQDQVGTASSVSINSRKIEEGTLLYQTEYNSQDWTGDFVAKCLDITGQVASCDRASCEETCNSTFESCVNSCSSGTEDCFEDCITDRTNCSDSAGCEDLLTCAEQEARCDNICGTDPTDPNCPTGVGTCETQRSECDLNPPEVKWSAAEKLETKINDFGHGSRVILTANASGNGRVFSWAQLGGSLNSFEYKRSDADPE